MRIVFEDDTLRQLSEDPDFKPKKWGRDVILAYRKKIQLVTAAQDERDLRAIKSLHLEKLEGDRVGTSSIRLNDKYRLILRFTTDNTGRTAVVLELVDYH